MNAQINAYIPEQDFKLLQFKTYNDYLDSVIMPIDLFYLENISVARDIARLGCFANNKTYDEATFWKHRKAIKNLLYPTKKITMLASESMKPTNDLQRELSIREKENRNHKLLTIIFLCKLNKCGNTIIAYIDFADRLAVENWVPFFRSEKELKPHKNDLFYYNSYTKTSLLNESSNFKPSIDKNNDLVFQNLHDGKILCFDNFNNKNFEVKKYDVKLEGYEFVTIFDYSPRSRLQY